METRNFNNNVVMSLKEVSKGLLRLDPSGGAKNESAHMYRGEYRDAFDDNSSVVA